MCNYTYWLLNPHFECLEFEFRFSNPKNIKVSYIVEIYLLELNVLGIGQYK